MENIGEYELIAQNNAEKLNARVNEQISQGWQPYGSPVVKGDYWAQAMVKPREPIKTPRASAYRQGVRPLLAIATLTALSGESTVSTGKPGFSTPPGRYHVVSKDRNHISSEFGDYVDDSGKVVKSNIDSRTDSQPPGTHFDGARMAYCMHFNGGYAMHEGYVPPYAASHGCIRLPKGMAEHFFDASSEGTPVIVKK